MAVDSGVDVCAIENDEDEEDGSEDGSRWIRGDGG